jgi:hypothetical protein
MTAAISAPQLSVAAQMAFYLGVTEDSIHFLESAFDVDGCTIEVGGNWFDVYFDPTGLVTEYLPA